MYQLKMEKLKTMKYVSLDCEMTGLSIEDCDILEFGCVLDDLEDQQPIDELPTFQCYFLSPHGHNIYKGEAMALSMHKEIFLRIEEQNRNLYNFYHPHKFGNMLKQFLSHNGHNIQSDKITINVAGKNVGFDIMWLEKKTDILKHVMMRHRVIDPSILLWNYDDDAIPGLAECKRRAGIEGEVEHTAVADALDIVKLVRYTMCSSAFLNINYNE